MDLKGLLARTSSVSDYYEGVVKEHWGRVKALMPTELRIGGNNDE